MTKESLKLMSDNEIELTKAFLKNSWAHSEHTEEFETKFKSQLELLNKEISESRIKVKPLKFDVDA